MQKNLLHLLVFEPALDFFVELRVVPQHGALAVHVILKAHREGGRERERETERTFIRRPVRGLMDHMVHRMATDLERFL